MKILYIFSLLAMGFGAKSQDIPFQNAKNWKIYLIKDRNKLRYPVDTLKNFKNYSLNADSMSIYLKSPANLGQIESPAWMGSHIITYELKDTVRKLDVSVYGGFFYDETTRTYYQLGEELTKEWQDYLAGCATYLQQNN